MNPAGGICRRRGFLIVSEFLFALLILYLLHCSFSMIRYNVKSIGAIRTRIFASYFAEGVTIESLAAKGAGLQSANDVVPCHISALGSLRVDFQRISFDRGLLPDVDIIRYTTSCPLGVNVDNDHSELIDSNNCNIVNTSVLWYEAGVERTVIVSATL